MSNCSVRQVKAKKVPLWCLSKSFPFLTALCISVQSSRKKSHADCLEKEIFWVSGFALNVFIVVSLLLKQDTLFSGCRHRSWILWCGLSLFNGSYFCSMDFNGFYWQGVSPRSWRSISYAQAELAASWAFPGSWGYAKDRHANTTRFARDDQTHDGTVFQLTENTCALKKQACILNFLRLHRLAHSPEANGEWLQSVDHGQPAEL